MSNKCKKCGAILEDNMMFCSNCGNRVKNIMSQTLKLSITCVLSLILVLTSSFSVMGLFICSITSQDNIASIIEEIDFAEIRTGFLSKNSKRETLPELIHNNIHYLYINEVDVRDVEELVNEDFVKEFVIEQATEYLDDAFHNNDKGVIKVKEVKDFLKDNKSEINDTLGFEFDDEYYYSIVDFMELNDFEERSELSNFRDDNEEIFNVIELFGSPSLFILGIVVSVILIIAIFCVNGLVPTSFISVSVCFGALALAQSAINKLISTTRQILDDEFPIGDDIYDVLFNSVESKGKTITIVFIVLFVTFLVGSFVIKKLKFSK